MGANLDVSTLRSILGEHSESVWSDNDLRSYLGLANLTVWKIISDMAPELVTYPYMFKVGSGGNISFANNVTTVTDEVIDASDSGIGVSVASIRGVYESKSPPAAVGKETYTKVKVKTMSGAYPVLENSNTLFNDLEIPNLYQQRMAVFDYGTQSLTIHPPPSKDRTYMVQLITEAPVYIRNGATTQRTITITESSSDDSALLGVERLSGDSEKFIAPQAHHAVYYEAAYQASFVDKSLRREFGTERDRLLSLVLTPHTMTPDEAY